MSDADDPLLALLKDLELLCEREIACCGRSRVLELIPLVRRRQRLVERIEAEGGGRSLAELARDPRYCAVLSNIERLSREALVRLSVHRDELSERLAGMQQRRVAMRSYSRGA